MDQITADNPAAIEYHIKVVFDVPEEDATYSAIPCEVFTDEDNHFVALQCPPRYIDVKPI
jgi:hypothetical protein